MGDVGHGNYGSAGYMIEPDSLDGDTILSLPLKAHVDECEMFHSAVKWPLDTANLLYRVSQRC